MAKAQGQSTKVSMESTQNTISAYVRAVTKEAAKKCKSATIQATQVDTATTPTAPRLAQSQSASTPAYEPSNAGHSGQMGLTRRSARVDTEPSPVLNLPGTSNSSGISGSTGIWLDAASGNLLTGSPTKSVGVSRPCGLQRSLKTTHCGLDPIECWFIETVLRAALVNARAIHSMLSIAE
ncbi:hypothetical protein N7491_008456 [Penicillium cf. griseofulvum]|uniref:Uncharacterized protein n=1 Tax=Penicillium cf. griseofulvum TaxID=2972120 RepID=A0A9W9MG98_9EURO|nr:hypothetical protein N7472_005941 [Penicillium cf. griseofulvum]KAJ5423240.1 hypothetical protein N7491_008456 [Penicillium cf. griseofulvum]KAJ5431487.1 hypothetical protein N7445_009219 [Penicillium cf. griseofulvum]